MASASSAPAQAAPAEPALFEALDLECVRHDRALFSDLSFRLDAGQIVQVEGPNGSGKTSLLRMLCGMLVPVRGEVRWRGTDIQDSRSMFLAEVAYVGHAHGIKEELTPMENLRAARALGRRREGITLEQALQHVGLFGFEDVAARTLSAGQRRRVALARLLVTQATLWVLDEPFTALDRTGKRLIERMLESHSHAGGIAVLTTHQPVELPNCPMAHIHLGS